MCIDLCDFGVHADFAQPYRRVNCVSGIGSEVHVSACIEQGPKEVEGLTFVDQLAAGATHVVAIVSHTTAADYDLEFEDDV